MNISHNAVAPILGLALAASALVACSPSDTAPAAQDPVATDAAVQPSPPEADAAAAAPATLPTGPEMDVLRSWVGMSAGMYALGEACAPGQGDKAAVLEATRKAPMRQHLGLSDAQMDALFDAEYAKNKQKIDAKSDAEIAAACKQIEDAAAAAAAQMQDQGGQ